LSAEAVFGKTLRRLRVEAQLTQEEVGLRSEMHLSAVARLEGGNRSPNLRTIVRLAAALGVPPAALLADLPPEVPPSARSPRVGRT
jgi:transcriptional regulator with XRE-family HTH domain